MRVELQPSTVSAEQSGRSLLFALAAITLLALAAVERGWAAGALAGTRRFAA